MVYKVAERTDLKGIPLYSFKNQYGVIYTLLFKEYTFYFWGNHEEELKEGLPRVLMLILKASEKRPKYDPFVEKTVIETLLRVLDNNKLILYVCDNADCREEARALKFRTQFKRSKYNKKFVLSENSMQTDKGELYVGMILAKEIPYKESAMQAFSE